MRASLLFLLFATACGFPQPQRIPDAQVHDASDDGPIDAGVDAGIDAPPGTEFSGEVSSGGGVMQSGTMTLVDDGLEILDWACSGTICVSGGVTP